MNIAIIGSGPSAVLYNNRCDISIGVNGAAMLGYRYDYFLAGDDRAHLRDWFDINCSNVRLIAAIVATMDKQLYPDYLYRNLCRRAVQVHRQNEVLDLPDPVSPHKTFLYRPFDIDKLDKGSPYLMYRGTIACCALQLAWKIGATKVDLYGCNFSHSSGNYFYSADHVGSVRETMVSVMQSLINFLRDNNMKVTIHGDSLLQ